jgi:hypothetical protein
MIAAIYWLRRQLGGAVREGTFALACAVDRLAEAAGRGA